MSRMNPADVVFFALMGILNPHPNTLLQACSEALGRPVDASELMNPDAILDELLGRAIEDITGEEPEPSGEVA